MIFTYLSGYICLCTFVYLIGANSKNIYCFCVIGSLTGGSGGGHGGSGGRGEGVYTVGQGYDSIYTPVHYGSPGGFGKYRGELFYFGEKMLMNRSNCFGYWSEF